MQDRVSLYPGRVKLVPVAGQENTYDMVRADSPTQEGTPLNKDSLLKDATAALFGLGADAVPDDVLNAASLRLSALDAAVFERPLAQFEAGSYAGTGSSSVTLTFSFTPKVFWVYAKKPNDLVYTLTIDTKQAHPATWGTDGWYTHDGSSNVYHTKLTYNGNSVTLKSQRTDASLSVSGYTYYYFAIG